MLMVSLVVKRGVQGREYKASSVFRHLHTLWFSLTLDSQTYTDRSSKVSWSIQLWKDPAD